MTNYFLEIIRLRMINDKLLMINNILLYGLYNA